MLQSATSDFRQPNERADLDTSHTSAIGSAAHGDFARGQRPNPGHGRSECDFATGTRNAGTPTTIGDFATGMRTVSPAVTTHHLTTGRPTPPLAA
ncbi:MAG TPA: hypothetical protein VIK04_13440 [Solirubrobacteraceae bacterium]